MGFAQGFLIPCGSLIVAKWFTLHEKSTAMAIFTTGNQIGLSVAMFFTARLCQIPLLGGWPSAFVLSGLVALLFLLLWIPFAADRPRDSRFITAAELEHINGQTVKHRAMSISVKTPYKKIFLCPVVLAICLCSFCQSFVIVSLATYLPQYNQSALKLDISSNGIWASLPFIVQMLTKFLFAFSADHLKKRHISINLITKTFNSLEFSPPSAAAPVSCGSRCWAARTTCSS
uniref:MFS domain-containing protein n=1 Tax=Steinernema glaseri TaxID=37863 RepID=A0A1I7ZQL3_9BILA